MSANPDELPVLIYSDHPDSGHKFGSVWLYKDECLWLSPDFFEPLIFNVKASWMMRMRNHIEGEINRKQLKLDGRKI